FHPGLRKIDDGPQYLLLAKSLSMGRSFSNLAYPGVPDFLTLPSAFPFLLTPYWWFLAPHESPLYLILALAMGLGGWMAGLWLETLLPKPQAWLVAFAF